MAIPTLGAMIAAIGSPAEWAAVSTTKLAWDDSTNSLFISGAITGSQPAGLIKVGGGGDSWYGIGTSTSAGGATAVGGYYPYAIHNHTGLAFSAHTSYGGIRFYNQPYPTAPMGATAVMAVVNGRVGILTESPSQALGVAGNIYASGNYQGVSSASYGSIEVGGSKGGYSGVYYPYSGIVGGMYSSAGLGGDYDNTDGKWVYYYNRANSCFSIGTPWNSSSSYRLYVTGPTYMSATGTQGLDVINEVAHTSGNYYGGVFECGGVNETGGMNVGCYAYVYYAATNWAFYSQGNSFATGGNWTGSDQKLKKDISNLSGASILSKLVKLKGISHKWDQEAYPHFGYDDKTHYGLLAQDIELDFPDLVRTMKHKNPKFEDDEEVEFKITNYVGFIPLLTEAIKELNTRLEKLDKKSFADPNTWK